MSKQALDPNEVRIRGVRALRRELGPAGMVQFLPQLTHGRGDYTKERNKILDTYTVDQIFAEIKSNRRKK